MERDRPARNGTGAEYAVIHHDGPEEAEVFSGTLVECEDWVALEGDRFCSGVLEIRRRNRANDSGPAPVSSVR